MIHIIHTSTAVGRQFGFVTSLLGGCTVEEKQYAMGWGWPARAWQMGRGPAESGGEGGVEFASRLDAGGGGEARERRTAGGSRGDERPVLFSRWVHRPH